MSLTEMHYTCTGSISRRVVACICAVFAIFAGSLAFFCLTVDFEGEFEGIYLLRDPDAFSFTVQNDLFLGDERRLVARLDFEPLYDLISGDTAEIPFLSCEWSNRQGRGFIIDHLPGGKRHLTCFGRFRDSDGIVPRGLFVGGGLPASRKEDVDVTMNETGMAYYDGREWHHLWCSVNEAIAASENPADLIPPSKWKYLGSSVIERNSKSIILKSSHEVILNGAPMAIDRFVFFRAGTPYFVLGINITNRSDKAVTYHYVYGDEPWVGEFGTSVGNVGWVRDRCFYYEGEVDTRTYSFAGMYDGGNKMILGRKGTFSGYANFIEWLGPNRPDLVYFSNTIGSFHPESEHIPLYSKDNRVIFLQWGPRYIQSGARQQYLIAVGMAGKAGGGLPVKPEVVVEPRFLEYLQRP